MKTEEAIKWFEKQLLCNQTRLAKAYFDEPFEEAIKALKIAKRFDGAMYVHWGISALPNHVKNYDLFAIPKEVEE